MPRKSQEFNPTVIRDTPLHDVLVAHATRTDYPSHRKGSWYSQVATPTRNVTLAELLPLAKQPLDLTIIVYLQEPKIIPGKLETCPSQFVQDPREHRYGIAIGDQSYGTARVIAGFIEEFLAERRSFQQSEIGDPELDYSKTRRGESLLQRDAFSTFLAYKCVTSPQPLQLGDLHERAAEAELELDVPGLKRGFFDLVAKRNVKLLQQSFPDLQKEKLYQGVAEWLRIIALAQTSKVSGKKQLSPASIYPSVNKEDYPEIDFLPYVMAQYPEYFKALPRVLHRDQYIYHRDLVTIVHEAEKTTQTILKQHILDSAGVESDQPFLDIYQTATRLHPEAAREVAPIYKQVKASLQKALNVVGVFMKHPGLINRTLPPDLYSAIVGGYIEYPERFFGEAN